MTWGNLSDKTKYFWFVLHGSKMLGEQMIYKFKDFDPDQHFVVAPEALNRFYANGFGGDVVASWMTSRDRLKEIEDFSNYLTKLYTKFMSQLNNDCHKVLLGFSQGGTTLFRWLHAQSVNCDSLIGYSCWFPEDINLELSATDLSQHKIVYTYGTEDQFLNQERIEALNEVIRKNKLQVKVESYLGDHRVDRQQLLKLFKSYIKI